MWRRYLTIAGMNSDRILPLRMMARRLGVTQKWLREQADAGVVPHLRAGNRYIFEPNATEESLAKEAAKDKSGIESVPGLCQPATESAAEQRRTLPS
jgi:hypothetical protein